MAGAFQANAFQSNAFQEAIAAIDFSVGSSSEDSSSESLTEKFVISSAASVDEASSVQASAEKIVVSAAATQDEGYSAQTVGVPFVLVVGSSSQDYSAQSLTEQFVISSGASSDETSSAETMGVPIPPLAVGVGSSSEASSDYLDTPVASSSTFGGYFTPIRGRHQPPVVLPSVRKDEAKKPDKQKVRRTAVVIPFSVKSSSRTDGDLAIQSVAVPVVGVVSVGSIEGGNPVPENGTGGEVVSSGRTPRRAEPAPSDLDSLQIPALPAQVSQPAPAVAVAPNTPPNPIVPQTASYAVTSSGYTDSACVIGHIAPAPNVQSWSPETEDADDDIAIIAGLYALIMDAA